MVSSVRLLLTVFSLVKVAILPQILRRRTNFCLFFQGSNCQLLNQSVIAGCLSIYFKKFTIESICNLEIVVKR